MNMVAIKYKLPIFLETTHFCTDTRTTLYKQISEFMNIKTRRMITQNSLKSYENKTFNSFLQKEKLSFNHVYIKTYVFGDIA